MNISQKNAYIIIILLGILILGGHFYHLQPHNADDHHSPHGTSSIQTNQINFENNQNSTSTNTKNISPAAKSSITKGKVVIISITPNSGPRGTIINVNGSGFTEDENVIKFGGYTITSNASSDGKTLEFTVPNQFQNCYKNACTDAIIRPQPGEYEIRVENSKGISNHKIFIVTSGCNKETPCAEEADVRI